MANETRDRAPPGWPPGCPKCGNQDGASLFLTTEDVPIDGSYRGGKRITGKLCGACDHRWTDHGR